MIVIPTRANFFKVQQVVAACLISLYFWVTRLNSTDDKEQYIYIFFFWNIIHLAYFVFVSLKSLMVNLCKSAAFSDRFHIFTVFTNNSEVTKQCQLGIFKTFIQYLRFYQGYRLIKHHMDSLTNRRSEKILRAIQHQA